MEKCPAHSHFFEESMEDREKQLIDVAELAKRLNVPESWVYGQCRQRKATGFPVIKLGKYLRFNYSDVIKWGQRND